MSVQLVVFDMAGTTIADDGVVNQSLRQALATAGLDVTAEAVNEVMGLPKPEAIRLLIEGSLKEAELTPRIDSIHRDFVSNISEFYANDASVREMPGARDLFVRLKEQGIPVAINTGFSRPIAQILIDRFGWSRDGLIQASITSDEVQRGRPYSDMIDRLRGVFGIQDAARVAKVGDTPSDLQEGTNAGCGIVVGYTKGTTSREELSRHPHTILVDSLEDLVPVLGLSTTA